MISVIMGAHRMDEYVYPAIDSILNQKNIELELIVVANGSQHQLVKESLQEHYAGEARLRIITSPLGQLAHALNIGLSHARYDYVARMDADDISHPDRLARQLDYLMQHDLDLVGTSADLINSAGEKTGVRHSPTSNKINKTLVFQNAFIHPSVLYKKQTIIDARGYNSGLNSEDYDLWLRLRRQGAKWDNMQESLIDYRLHDRSTQGNILAYAETAGYALREFILSKNPLWLLSAFVTLGKAFVRGR